MELCSSVVDQMSSSVYNICQSKEAARWVWLKDLLSGYNKIYVRTLFVDLEMLCAAYYGNKQEWNLNLGAKTVRANWV